MSNLATQTVRERRAAAARPVNRRAVVLEAPGSASDPLTVRLLADPRDSSYEIADWSSRGVLPAVGDDALVVVDDEGRMWASVSTPVVPPPAPPVQAAGRWTVASTPVSLTAAAERALPLTEAAGQPAPIGFTRSGNNIIVQGDGWYAIDSYVQINGNAYPFSAFSVLRRNETEAIALDGLGSAANFVRLSNSTTIWLEAGDTISLNAYANPAAQALDGHIEVHQFGAGAPGAAGAPGPKGDPGAPGSGSPWATALRWSGASWLSQQVEVPEDGTYLASLSANTTAAGPVTVTMYLDGLPAYDVDGSNWMISGTGVGSGYLMALSASSQLVELTAGTHQLQPVQGYTETDNGVTCSVSLTRVVTG